MIPTILSDHCKLGTLKLIKIYFKVTGRMRISSKLLNWINQYDQAEPTQKFEIISIVENK